MAFGRTVRSKRYRRMLFKEANGVCRICGGPLKDEDDWEVHHDPPYAASGRTVLYEQYAVHASCNRSKGSKQ